MVNIQLKNLSELENAARAILNSIGDSRFICFYGSMAAGKTTLIKAMCAELGVKDVVTSPTFALINEYKTAKGTKVFHFDFYRIRKLEEVYDFGYEEYFYNNDGLCLIEWPELVEDLLPSENVCRLTITVNSDQSRSIQISL